MNYDENKWHRRWMDMAELVATWSKDRSRQCGAIIVTGENTIKSIGYNGFPRFINDDIGARHARPAKYKWTEHAERNAIYNCARNGVDTFGCTMYLPWYPCADCARAIIQAGIFDVVCYEPDWADPVWSADFDVVKEMLAEAGVDVTFIEGTSPALQEDANV